MKNIKKYKLLHSTPAHFVLHDGEAYFHIAKKGLDKETIEKIKSFSEGGEIENPVEKEKREIFSSNRAPASIEIEDPEEKKTAREEFAEKIKRGAGFKAEGGQVEYPSKEFVEQLKKENPKTQIPGLQNLKDPLKENDFTFPGEAIPLDAGIAEYLKYLAARTETPSEEDIVSMGQASGGLKKVPYKALVRGTNTLVESPAGYAQASESTPEEMIEYEKALKKFADKVEKPHKIEHLESNIPGYGTKILNKIEDKVKSRWADSVYLNASPFYSSTGEPPRLNLEELVQFYKKRGYIPVKDGGNNVIMFKKFARGGDVQFFPDGGEVANVSMQPQTFSDPNTSEQAQASFDPNLPSPVQPNNFDEQVKAEQVRLANDYIATRPPGDPLPATADPTIFDKFKTQAETNVAERALQQEVEAAQRQKAEREAVSQQASEEAQKIMRDNEIRAKAGLPLIPTKETPQQEAPKSPGQVVPKDQQISLTAPKAEEGYQNPLANLNFSDEYKQTMGNIATSMREQGRLESVKQAENAKMQQAFVRDEKDRQKKFLEAQEKLRGENDLLFKQIASNQIDPNRLWNNAGTGAKIGAALGILFAGIGSGLTGQPNQAVSFIEKMMNNDLEAQKADTSNRVNLYKLGLERYRDAQDAAKFASLQASAILAGQMQQMASKIGSPQAIQAAEQMINEMKLKNHSILLDLSLKDVALRHSKPLGSGTSTSSGININKLVSFMNAGLYDEATKKEIIHEQGEYQKLKNLLDHTDITFKKAMANATYTQRLPGASKVPDYREATKQYESTVRVFLDKITKDTTGRVTPESMKHIRASMPLVDDSPATLASKINDVKSIIKGAFVFPVLINKGLLHPDDEYIVTEGNIEKKFNQGKPVINK